MLSRAMGTVVHTGVWSNPSRFGSSSASPTPFSASPIAHPSHDPLSNQVGGPAGAGVVVMDVVDRWWWCCSAAAGVR